MAVGIAWRFYIEGVKMIQLDQKSYPFRRGVYPKERWALNELFGGKKVPGGKLSHHLSELFPHFIAPIWQRQRVVVKYSKVVLVKNF